VYSNAGGQGAKQYSFTHLSTSEGLAANMVTGIVQDEQGYMWISTINGLQRYDGNVFMTYRNRIGYPTTVPSNNIPVLFLDRKNTLWICDANNRLGTFNTKTFRFKPVPVDYHVRKNEFIQKYFFEAHTGDLMLHEKFTGLYRFDSAARGFVRADDFIPVPKNWKRDNIVWDKVGRKYWMACDSGLVAYDPFTRRISYRGNNQDREPAIQAMENVTDASTIFTNSKGDVFFYTWERTVGTPTIHAYNKATGDYGRKFSSWAMSIAYNEIIGMFEQANGRLWIYGHPFMAEWKGKKEAFNLSLIPNEYRNEQSIKFDYMYKMYEDREKNVWLCTDNGVYHFNPDGQVFNTYNLVRSTDAMPYEAPANAFLETANDMYIGCWGVGLYHYDKSFNVLPMPAEVQPAYASMSIWDMHHHSRSGLNWIVQQGGFIYVFDPLKHKRWELQPAIFENSTIRQVVEDRQGNLWFGTQSGMIVKWDYRAGAQDPSGGYTLVEKYKAISKMIVDPQGYIWAASNGFGVIKINPLTGQVIREFTGDGPEGEKLFGDNPTDIFVYDDTTLVVVNGALDLINTSTNRVSHFTVNDGLPSNTAACGVKDKNKVLWIGMTNGLCRINLQKDVVSYFDRRDGIFYDKFNSAGAYNLSDGKLLFTTDHNFLVFNPLAVVEPTQPVKPIITGFKTGSEELLVDSLSKEQKLVLRYHNNSISFSFSALSFHKQKKLHYFYKLEGLDEDWIHTENAHQAVYSYLPPGKYVFRLKSENADGLVSEETTSFQITVRAPIWKTFWFYGALFLLAIALLVYLDKERMKRLRAVQQMRSSIANNLHQDINTTLNNINILSEMAKMKADRDLGRSKEYIQQISEKSHNMIIAMDDMLWSIDPKNDTMSETLMRLREFIAALQSRHQAIIQLSVDNKVHSLILDMKVRHEFFLLAKSALRAVVEDCGGKKTSVHIDFHHHKLHFKIQDETALDSGSHMLVRRIEEMENRAAAIAAELDMQIDRKGVSVIVLVPLYG
jgi:ligand-binding sensor domain-containing protein